MSMEALDFFDDPLENLRKIHTTPACRFNPSVTGMIHLGHALNMWANFFQARAMGGRFYVLLDCHFRTFSDFPGDIPEFIYGWWEAHGVSRGKSDISSEYRKWLDEYAWYMPGALPDRQFYLCYWGDEVTFPYDNMLRFLYDAFYAGKLRPPNCLELKALLEMFLNINTVIRGSDLRDGAHFLIRQYEEIVSELWGPRNICYHPILLENGIKMSKTGKNTRPLEVVYNEVLKDYHGLTPVHLTIPAVLTIAVVYGEMPTSFDDMMQKIDTFDLFTLPEQSDLDISDETLFQIADFAVEECTPHHPLPYIKGFFSQLMEKRVT